LRGGREIRSDDDHLDEGIRVRVDQMAALRAPVGKTDDGVRVNADSAVLKNNVPEQGREFALSIDGDWFYTTFLRIAPAERGGRETADSVDGTRCNEVLFGKPDIASSPWQKVTSNLREAAAGISRPLSLGAIPF
jgi:hypothetical protein